MVINNLKYSALTVAPNHKEIDYWIDLTEDPNGGIIKFWNGEIWDYLNRMDDQDRDIANEIARAKAAEQLLLENIDSEELLRINADNQLRNSINQEIQDRTEADNEINETIDSIKIEKINNLLYELKINNVTVSTIDIPKDQYIKDIDYNADTNELIFIFETNTGEVTLRVDLTSLGLDVNTTYTFTDGTNGSFTVTSSDGIIKVINVGKPATAGTADLALEVEWDNVESKPSTFTPSAHNHTTVDITDFPTLSTVATSGSYNDLIDKPNTTVADLDVITTVSTQYDPNQDYITVSMTKNNTITGVAASDVTGSTIYAANADRMGYMTSVMFNKLNSIEDNANNYILPNATGTTIGGVKQSAAVEDTIIDGSETTTTVATTLNNLLAALRSAGILAV